MKKQEKKIKSKLNKGFTLIELLVVISIIGLLASVVLIALQDARIKSRDAKRLADITQMASVLTLFYNTNNGYPTSAANSGIPSGIVPGYAASLPKNTVPADGSCGSLTNPQNLNVDANVYYYYPTGTPQSNGYYPDYRYYFCLGQGAGNYKSGIHTLSPSSLQ